MARAILAQSLAPSTRAGYRSAVNNLARFCEEMRFPLQFPISSETICLWMAHVADKLTYSTIRVYLHGIATTHVELGHESPVAAPLVWRMYRAIKRLQGHSAARERLPITLEVLRKLERWQDCDSRAGLCIRAAMWAGTCGLMRSGEFAVRNRHSNVLRRSDLTFVDDNGVETTRPRAHVAYMRLHIAQSKTDPFREGTHIVIANRTAIDAMLAYVDATHHRSSDLPLFMVGGRALDVSTLVQRTQNMLQLAGIANADKYTGHSFRRGGATSLHVAGVSDSLIKVMGRWKSFAFVRYIDTPIDLIMQASKAMSDSMEKGRAVRFSLPHDSMSWDSCPWE